MYWEMAKLQGVSKGLPGTRLWLGKDVSMGCTGLEPLRLPGCVRDEAAGLTAWCLGMEL